MEKTGRFLIDVPGTPLPEELEEYPAIVDNCLVLCGETSRFAFRDTAQAHITGNQILVMEHLSFSQRLAIAWRIISYSGKGEA